MIGKTPLRFHSVMSPFWLTSSFGWCVTFFNRRTWSSTSNMGDQIVLPNHSHHNIHAKILFGKRCKFCLKLIVSQKNRGYKTNTLSHAVSKVVFGQKILCSTFSNIHVGKMRFSASSQNSISEKSFSLSLWGHFFSTYTIFPGRGWSFLVTKVKEQYFNEKMSSLVGFNKIYSNSSKSSDFAHF